MPLPSPPRSLGSLVLLSALACRGGAEDKGRDSAPPGDDSAAEDTGSADSDTHGEVLDTDTGGEDSEGEDTSSHQGTSLADADAVLWATSRDADAGRHMDLGDIDGDGRLDLVAGEMWARGQEGGAFVVYGPVSASGELDELGYEIEGGDDSYEAGRSVGVDDVDGDGLDDVLLGAPDAPGYDAVVLLGPIDSSLEFEDADIRTWCTSNVECGHGGDLADLDGDGVAEAIIGAGEEDTGGEQSGSVYVLFGPLSARDLNLRAEADIELVGVSAGVETGRVLQAGVDLDGDGIGDLLVTAGYDDTGGPDAGAVHVVHSPVVEGLDLDDADGKLLGASSYAYAGESLAMGDLDGDGLGDAIVGAAAGRRQDGSACAVAGPATGTVSLSDGFAVARGDAGQSLGSAVAARDVDGDDLAELLVGAATDATGGRAAGAAYLFAGPVSGGLDSSDAARAFVGAEGGDTAGSGAALGDLDGDGGIDALIGAPTSSEGATDAGAVFLVGLGGS